jgi:hypothetical protein
VVKADFALPEHYQVKARSGSEVNAEILHDPPFPTMGRRIAVACLLRAVTICVVYEQTILG